MRFASLVPVVIILAACASSAPRPDSAADLDRFYDQDLEYSGHLGGVAVAGHVSFERESSGAIEYTFTGRGPVCRDDIARPTEPRIQIGCNGLTIRINRLEPLPMQAYATIVTSRVVQREECSEWQIDRNSGRRVCASWHTVSVDEPVRHTGSVDIRYPGT
jgi:hypothetical protein